MIRENQKALKLAKESLMNRIAGEIIMSPDPGAAMRKWRELFGISKSELAKEIGFVPSVLSDYEKSRRKSPGTSFIKKFVSTLISIDEKRGGNCIEKYSLIPKDLSKVILDMAEFIIPRTVQDITKAIDGVILACKESINLPIYGYTIINSIEAIKTLTGNEFIQLFGINSMRALIFIDVSKGRSPMVAVRIYPIKPKMVVIHGPKSQDDVDKLAIELAELDYVPLVLSLKPSVEELIDSMKRLKICLLYTSPSPRD